MLENLFTLWKLYKILHLVLFWLYNGLLKLTAALILIAVQVKNMEVYILIWTEGPR